LQDIRDRASGISPLTRALKQAFPASQTSHRQFNNVSEAPSRLIA